MSTLRHLLLGIVIVVTPVMIWRLVAREGSDSAAADVRIVPPAEVELRDGMARIVGGAFTMGSAAAAEPDQWPPHEVTLDAFWIDVEVVTCRDFARFVDATGYITTAERRGTSLVFDPLAQRWQEVQRATWRTPLGGRSSLVGRERYPVVHVSWHDAQAYTTWAGKRLLTEAEYESAARGGLLAQTFAWGNEIAPDERPMANFWQGKFPIEDRGLDNFRDLAPVGRFPANRWQLRDMTGNCWCWTADVYDADYYQYSPNANPAGSSEGSERGLRGGSYLTPASRITVATRGHAAPDHTSCDIGFRCAR